ncbi:MAG: glycosyltransferase [Bacteroides sp.]|nr:glycosyltransferase [Bacteroides sp.]MCM1413237.1 glycosyltransferase [Bacteroides sp.]MCM1471453.1 glycosyltransferase [Bacteroides sp.]
MTSISVIVPVYNAECYLRECVDSILAQTFADFELILVDDGSKDSSTAICDEYAARDPRVRVIHQANAGVSAARNAGLDAARGEWISFVDADDWIEPEMLGDLICKAQEKNADVVSCDFCFAYSDGHTEPHKTFEWDHGYKTKEDALAGYINNTWTITWACIIERALLVSNNIYYPIGLRWCEDFNVAVKVFFFAKKIAKVDRAYYMYRQNEQSICHNMSNNLGADALKSYEDVIEFFMAQNVYPKYTKAMAWRSLWHSHPLALAQKRWSEFLSHNPDKKHYIFDCPHINTKMKVITWCLTHHLRPVAWSIVTFRNILGR